VCTFGAVLVLMAVVKALFFRVKQEQAQAVEVRTQQVV
jgi:hypothetical protein